MILKLHTDGGSKGNPGPAAIGIVVYEPYEDSIPQNPAESTDPELFSYREDIGVATNNEAEYTALIRALELVLEKEIIQSHSIERVDCFLDSQLVVRQLNGEYKVKNSRIREFILAIRSLEADVSVPIRYHHIRREKNVRADALVNGAL